MGMRANWRYDRREPIPMDTEREGTVRNQYGDSIPKHLQYSGTGGAGIMVTFYTVPTGKVFQLKSVKSSTGMTISAEGVGSWSDGDSATFDVPITMESGKTLKGWQAGTASVFAYGIEESAALAAKRNYL